MDEDDQEDLDKKIAGRDYQARKSLNYGRRLRSDLKARLQFRKMVAEKDARINELEDEIKHLNRIFPLCK